MYSIYLLAVILSVDYGNSITDGCCDCLIPLITPGCSLSSNCQDTICLIDPWCCQQQWDAVCVNFATPECKNNDNITSIIYVDERNLLSQNQTGNSWSSAFSSLTNALSLANDYDEIWIANGTYYPTTDNDRAKS
eukprot:266794_1